MVDALFLILPPLVLEIHIHVMSHGCAVLPLEQAVGLAM